MKKLLIRGQKALKGTVTISGSKNAALPLVGACLLSKEKSVLKNVPDIADIRTLIIILEFLGCEVSFENEVLTIDPTNLENKEIPHDLVSKMRGSIILLAPLLAHFGEAKLAFPGGCVLGKRPVDSHLDAFASLGAEVVESEERIFLRAKNGLTGKQFCMSEMSVTASENAIMAAVLAKGKTQIRLCAAEPHVQDLCRALNEAGAKITGIGTHNLEIEGVKAVSGIQHSVCADYLEVGTYAIAAAITGGHVLIKNAKEEDLDIFWNKMKEMGVKFEHRDNEVEIFPSTNLKAVSVRTAVFPSFPTDLQAQFATLMTQANGTSKMFETLFEGKMNYVFELEKMGANVALMNNHQAMIFGKTKLKGCPVSSLDIRAGAAMFLAALAAEGETEISNINYIYRGYSHLVEKLQALGADIQEVS